ncbi:MAG: hypothetical protein GYA15_16260 [Leptolinea sp.]|jgi:hypothetical protein|nr:hypothetical protein [Leptolinea sp.]
MDQPRDPFLYPAIAGLTFLLLASMAAVAENYLIPLETWWPAIAASLGVYAIIDVLLITRGITIYFFHAIDADSVRPRDTLWPAAGPLTATFGVGVLADLPFDRVLPVMLLLCLLHTALTAAAVTAITAPRPINNRRRTAWTVSTALVTAAYAAAFFSLPAYPAANPLLEQAGPSRGVWFTVPVAKSETYPLGYARLEDGIIDDLGRPFMAALGQSLGLLPRCAVSGPDLHSFAQISPDPNVQPKFRTNVDTLCPEWIQALPGYFWRVGLIGLFLLSLVFGAFVTHHPIDFAVIALLMLFGWFVWPPSERVRVGNVPMLLAGMPWLALLLPVIRRGRSSPVVLWGLSAGLVFGLAGLVRQPVGAALTVTALAGIGWGAWKQKKIYLPLLALLALLAGRALPPAMLNSLFQYRDDKLQITAPVLTAREHGTGFAMLGGIGGVDLSPENYGAPLYENSMDLAFADVPIWLTIYNANPLITLTPSSYNLTLQTGSGLFWCYAASHPAEYLWIMCLKAGEYLTYMGIPLLALLSFVTLVVGRYAKVDPAARLGVSVEGTRETVGLFLVLALAASVPAMLTTIAYGENLFLPAAVFFFNAIPAFLITFKSILLKRRP